MQTPLLNGEGKVALVLGGASGIGSAVVRLFAQAGSRVVSADLKEGAGDEILSLQTDVTDEASVEAAVQRAAERFGRIDFAVNMAGEAGSGRLDALSLSEWQRSLEVNLTSCFLLAKHVYPHLKKSKGALVLCSSTNGLNGGSHLSGAAYAAAKAGILNLARYLAKEWAADGVRVNCVAPGPVDTPMVERLKPQDHEVLKKAIPLGRYASPEEVAGAVAFLCSDAAAHMTGTVMNISGGLVLD